MLPTLTSHNNPIKWWFAAKYELWPTTVSFGWHFTCVLRDSLKVSLHHSRGTSWKYWIDNHQSLNPIPKVTFPLPWNYVSLDLFILLVEIKSSSLIWVLWAILFHLPRVNLIGPIFVNSVTQHLLSVNALICQTLCWALGKQERIRHGSFLGKMSVV